MHPVLPLLHRLRREWMARRFMESLSRLLLLFLTAAVVLASIQLLAGGGLPGWPLLAGVPVLAAVCAAILQAIFQRPGLDQISQIYDRAASTSDRLQSALTFQAIPTPTPLQSAALEECSRWLASRDWRNVLPGRVPRAFYALPAPLAALALLAWYPLAPRHSGVDPALAQAASDDAAQLEALAKETAAAGDQMKNPDLAKLSEQIKKGADRVRQSSGDGQTDRKTLLKEFARLEEMLREMRADAAKRSTSPEELAALADALASQPSGSAAADALRQGDLAGASKKLEEMMEALNSQGNREQAMKDLANSMREKAEKLTDEQKNAVAKEMEQAAQEQKEADAMQKSLQRLSQLLSEISKTQQQGGPSQQSQDSQSQQGGTQLTQQQIDDLIRALEEMKNQGPGNKPSQKPGGGEKGEGQSLAIQFGPAPSSGDPVPGDIPGGAPGSEKDKGEGGDPKGEAGSLVKAEGPATRLPSAMGNGESLQEMIATAGGNPRSTRAYRDLYESLAPAARQSVNQEQIPVGSRFYIKRYFESIRPSN